MTLSERLADVRRRLTEYRAAESAALTSQEYWVDGKKLRRADLKDISETIRDLESQEAELAAKEAGGARRAAFRIVPRDL